jgi:hypothetical protein
MLGVYQALSLAMALSVFEKYDARKPGLSGFPLAG